MMTSRTAVWTVLSELYLDTQLDDADIARIAAVLHASPYETAEIERILRDEVAPAFSWNLLSIAGDWAPWDEAEVSRIVSRSLAKRTGGWLARCRAWFQPRIIPAEWHRIAALLG